MLSGLFLCDLQAVSSGVAGDRADGYIYVCRSPPETYRMLLRDVPLDRMYVVGSLSGELEDTLQVMDRELRRGKALAVFCETAHQRAPSLVVAYLVRFAQMSYDQAVAAVMSRSDAAFPRPCVYAAVLQGLAGQQC